jgi:Uma2 family endonuclease
MITTPEDLAIHTAADFERLPAEGHWEVVDGRAVLLPGNDLDHQEILDELSSRLDHCLRRRGTGRRNTTVNVDIPGPEFRTRVPDIVIYERRPSGKRFHVGEPPEIVVEILATPRGNVERTEKIDDYARAGIAEYWIVNPFEQVVEIYRLEAGEYKLSEVATAEIESFAMPGVRIDLHGLWPSHE